MPHGRILVTGSFRIPVARLEDARPMMARIVAASRAEPGCLAYSYAEDIAEPGLIRVCEQWQSRAHLAAHFAMPHMTKWIEERTALGLSDRAVVAYSVTGEEGL